MTTDGFSRRKGSIWQARRKTELRPVKQTPSAVTFGLDDLDDFRRRAAKRRFNAAIGYRNLVAMRPAGALMLEAGRRLSAALRLGIPPFADAEPLRDASSAISPDFWNYRQYGSSRFEICLMRNKKTKRDIAIDGHNLILKHPRSQPAC